MAADAACTSAFARPVERRAADGLRIAGEQCRGEACFSSMAPAGAARFLGFRDCRWFVAAVVLIVAGLLAQFYWPSGSGRCPIALRVVSVEPTPGADARRDEMSLVTLSIGRADSRSRGLEHCYYLRSATNAIQAKVGNRWVGVGGSVACALAAHGRHERVLLMPGKAEACRVRFTYASTIPSLKWRLSLLAERLEMATGSIMPSTFWIWAYNRQVRPSSNWTEVTVELPFPPASAAAAPGSAVRDAATYADPAS